MSVSSAPVSSAPASSAGAGAPASTATTPSTTSTAATATATTPGRPEAGESGGASPSGTTRSAPEPKFVEGQSSSSADSSSGSSSGEGLGGALATLAARGYATKDTSVYHPDQTLRVLVGTRTGSSDGYGQQAFFFVDGRYIGTDASAPSARVRVVSQSDTEVTLAYQLYRPGDRLCCGSGGEGKVRFQLDNGKLMALDAIPPVEPAEGMGRR
ncbi:MAG TPA: LppP/LprE family lipoprotein [Solirubrobacteraceae bacterium]|nr:LppP/LprE family lipoprotein [Solirubrobacteraceae bacterium]